MGVFMSFGPLNRGQGLGIWPLNGLRQKLECAASGCFRCAVGFTYSEEETDSVSRLSAIRSYIFSCESIPQGTTNKRATRTLSFLNM